ncbi:hypothetical protein HYX14_04430 [Candidatus Woesearchaeota archaeon]|nr:hypothetical protein [Candidatus Woesearchaeota archaeon]
MVYSAPVQPPTPQAPHHKLRAFPVLSTESIDTHAETLPAALQQGKHLVVFVNDSPDCLDLDSRLATDEIQQFLQRQNVQGAYISSDNPSLWSSFGKQEIAVPAIVACYNGKKVGMLTRINGDVGLMCYLRQWYLRI